FAFQRPCHPLPGRGRRLRIDKLAQALEPYQLVFEAREARVEAARVWQHENLRATNQLGLGAGSGTPGLAGRGEGSSASLAEKFAVNSHSHEGDDGGPQTPDPRRKQSFALRDLCTTQLG